MQVAAAAVTAWAVAAAAEAAVRTDSATRRDIISSNIIKGSNSRSRGSSSTVLSLTECYNGSGRNIFLDGYFTNYNLCTQLLDNGLTGTGTIVSTRRDVPREIRNVKEREVLSTVELWEPNLRILLLSYVPKKGKNVLMMSSMHTSAEVRFVREDRKPQVILVYNAGKGGVDLSDGFMH